MVIEDKFIDGQLDECDLTLKDLDKIRSSFVHVLTGIHHLRVAYPEKADKGTKAQRRKGAKAQSEDGNKNTYL